jgi:probable dihydroxyacetone kinase regulator
MPDSQITKNVLAQSVKELMRSKSLEKISVGEIARNCGLNRQTFYYHFKDKYDLVNWIYYTEAVKIMSDSLGSGHWLDAMCNLCIYMQKEKKFYINALKATGQNSLQDYLVHFVYDIVMALLDEVKEEEPLTEEDCEFVADFYSYAFVGLILKWADNGMQEDPCSLFQCIRRLLKTDVIRSIQKMV